MAKLRMEDISRLAGVSLATVSRVIHSPHLVSPKTRGHVLTVMSEKNYVYNAAAADLSRKRSTVVGVLIPTTRSTIFASTVFSIQERCHDRGYSIILGNTKYDVSTEQRLLMQFQERRVAGVILTGFSLGQMDAVADLVHGGTPCVVIWEKLNDPRISYVGFDNYQAAFSMTEYVINLGHRRIGLIVGPYSKVGRVRKRLEGYLGALAKYGIEEDFSLVIEKEPTLENGRQAMRRLLGLRRRPTAVFGASDVLAIGSMRAAKEKGLRIPEDLSIAGFDDIAFAGYCDPPLTTVRVAGNEIGEMAVDVLLEAIEKDASIRRRYCLETELIVRASCCAPKKPR